MATYSITITSILNSWYELGVFDYLLPFLIIFALVYGILNKSKVLGDNRGVQAILALAIGMLSLLNDYVTNFFATIFPFAGIGLAVVLVALILMGLVTKDENHWSRYVWFGIGAIAFIAIVWSSFNRFSWNFGGGVWIQDLVPTIIILALVVGAVVWMIRSSRTPATH